ncbi:MAG: PaaI family thioesterase [Firmicutes bacterium]|nr:PaaI family thioesterase [Bacillota bacterium]
MDYQKLIEHRNRTNLFSQYVGIEITDIKEGYAETKLITRKEHLNPAGAVHGGVLYSLADIATGSAAASYGYHIATVDSSFNFLRAGLNVTELKAVAKERKHGKRISFFDVSVYDQDGNELASGSYTYTQLKTQIEL